MECLTWATSGSACSGFLASSSIAWWIQDITVRNLWGTRCSRSVTNISCLISIGSMRFLDRIRTVIELALIILVQPLTYITHMLWYAIYTNHMCWLDACNPARTPFLSTWEHSSLNHSSVPMGKSTLYLLVAWRLPCSLIRNPSRAPKKNCTRNRCLIDILPWRHIIPKCRQISIIG